MDSIRRQKDKDSTRDNVIRNLIEEINQNYLVLQKSTYIALPYVAWDEAKRTGVSLELNADLRRNLAEFYSVLIFRNGLLEYIPIEGYTGKKTMVITPNGQDKPIREVIGEYSDKMKGLAELIIQQLDGELEDINQKRRKRIRSSENRP